ncbi:hypothetical protein GETHLI_04980 [Geothrix limicola]|uniref:N-acetyltransferase domain-containing protein n=1 Tax=Geothrix limicola TaxID=2927978 RepID=A0ABQ5QCB5_9BACT|nr:GNAT family N-acetyltransferase [Geothrix limicola]GLH71996.1 hypothetical protein GETHLI_04980 [Geothrix limicola]
MSTDPSTSFPLTRPPTRVAGPSDIDEIVRVTNRAYVAEQFCLKGDRTDAADVSTRMREGRFLVIDDPAQKGKLWGLVYAAVSGNRGYLGTLSVDPAFQGQGLSKALVSAVEDHCRRAECLFLDITVVHLRKDLFPFYTKLGFAPMDVLPFPRPEKMLQPLHLVQMTKPLHPLEAL